VIGIIVAEVPAHELVERGRAAWPELAIDQARFAAFVAERLEDTSLASLHVEDLYLACGLVDGLSAALAAFDRECVPVIDRAVEASGATPAEVADLRQIVRQRLLVAPASDDGEATPRIATYTGRGNLKSWIKVVATREAARLLPRERREVAAEDDELAGLVARDDDPELGYLKRVYRAEFKAAFAAAVDALPDRERLVLRQNMLDGLSIDELAGFYRVHRATTARWIEAARKAVLEGTRKQLVARLQLSRSELDSIMRLIASNLDVSLPAALRR
jgi:RNA polymerase sigma-70 factor (ECF subfamily)